MVESYRYIPGQCVVFLSTEGRSEERGEREASWDEHRYSENGLLPPSPLQHLQLGNRMDAVKYLPRHLTNT